MERTSMEDDGEFVGAVRVGDLAKVRRFSSLGLFEKKIYGNGLSTRDVSDQEDYGLSELPGTLEGRDTTQPLEAYP